MAAELENVPAAPAREFLLSALFRIAGDAERAREEHSSFEEAVKSAVIVFPASNRDRDAAEVLEKVTGTKPHMVWHGDTEVPDVDLIVLPGGFSYGDYLRCGAMAAQSRIMRDVIAKVEEERSIPKQCTGWAEVICAWRTPASID